MLRNIFTFIVVIFPIFSIYGIGLGSFTLADLCLFLVIVPLSYSFCQKRRGRKIIALPFLFYSFYILIASFFIIAFSFNQGEMILRTLRYVFYTFIIALFVKKNFDMYFAEKVYIGISIFSVAFIILQTVLFSLNGHYIPGYLPYLPVLRTELIDYSLNIGLDGGDIRPRSIFGEPAHFSQYIVGCLIIVLFSQRYFSYRYTVALFLSLGILLSISSTGIICMLFIWVIFSLRVMTKNNKFLLYFPLVIFMSFILYITPFFQMFLDRMESGHSSAGRFSGYNYLFNEVIFDVSEFMWGHGMEKTFDQYLPGFANIYWFFGIVGLMLFISALLSSWKFFTKKQKLLTIIFIVLNLGTEVALGPFLLLYMSFILCKDENKFSDFKLQ